MTPQLQPDRIPGPARAPLRREGPLGIHMPRAASTNLALLTLSRLASVLLALIPLAGPVAAGEPVSYAQKGCFPGPRLATTGDRREGQSAEPTRAFDSLQPTTDDRGGGLPAPDPLLPRMVGSPGRPAASRPDPPIGRIRGALAQLPAGAGSDPAPPEPPREASPGKRKSFFRTRTGVVILIVAGAVIVGSAARNSVLGDS